MAAALNPRRRALSLLLAVLAAAALAACDGRLPGAAERPAFHSVDITGADYARELSLADVEGKPRTLADFKGQVVIVFFGYTQCPDVCPTTMTELAEVKRSLGADGARVVGIFVTVDPERDSAELLKAYMANFGPDMVGLRGTPEQTMAMAKRFKVFYAKVPGNAAGSYSVDHTAGSYVFDTQGRIRLFTRYGTGPKDLADDLRILLAEKA